MLKELLDKQRDYTDYFFTSLDLLPIERLVEFLLLCRGTIFFSGVGKSGLVAKKIAFTMVSTGTRAHFVSPTDAAHGDLGMVSANDSFIMLSKSGETEELINLAPAIKNKGASLISVVSNPNSRLAQVSNTIITLPFKHELCPFDMAPTMSTTNQLLFGDLLTIALMRHKKFSLDDYALNHPSGRIGKRITLKVKDLMLTGSKIPLCKSEDHLGEVLVELSNKRCGCILITNNDKQLLGIFTDGDLRRALQKLGTNLLTTPMKELMNQKPFFIGSDILAWDALKIMEGDPHKRITMLPVVDTERNIVGLLHMHDILQSGL